MFNSIKNGVKFVLKFLIVIVCIYAQYLLISNLFTPSNKCIFLISYLIQIICIFSIGNRKYDNDFKILWLIGVIAFPIIFAPIYFFSLFVRTKITKYNEVKEKKLKENNIKENDLSEKTDISNILKNENIELSKLNDFVYTSSNTYFRYSDIYKYFPVGEIFFDDFLNELKKAKKFIFINFFILSKGYMWDNIYDILNEKINSGVEVYIIFDHLGSFTTYPRKITKIKHKNFHVEIYNSLFSGIGPYINSRNHRKIIVIDGKIGYVGGINIADEYINKGKFKGYWKDICIKLNQNIVNDLSMMFIELWNEVSKTRINDIQKYMCNNEKVNTENGYVCVYGDRLYNKYYTGKSVYLTAINTAKKTIYIMTPYLILNEEISFALINSSRSGIDVKIITPKKPDNILVHTVTRSYYMELLEAGIEIYEYSPGFIHAKSMIIDDDLCILGSSNLDFRSMYMLYENNIIAYKVNELEKIKQDFINTFNSSEKIVLEKWNKRNIFEKMVEKLLRIFAPLF